MKTSKLLWIAAYGLALISGQANAATTYAKPAGSIIGGESTASLNGGAKLFYPAGISGALVASASGALVREDSVKVPAGTDAGVQVKSTLQIPQRSGMSTLYVDTTGKSYLLKYETYTADGSFNTAVVNKPVLLESGKYPELSTASRVFVTYQSSSVGSTYYLSGTNLYRTTALKPGSENSSTATLVENAALNVVGVDAGVFVRTAAGVSFYGAAGNTVGLSSIISPTVTDNEFKSIVSVHPAYYAMVFENGNHMAFKADGSYSNTIATTNRIGFVPYYSRSAQVAGHAGQTTFAWFTADYKLSYIDPYASEAAAIKSIDYSGQGGTKQTRALVLKVLSISEDGFVQSTGKNAAGTSFYLSINAASTMMTNTLSLTGTQAEALNSSAASVAWNNPSNVDWHYKVPPVAFGNTGSKNYFWKYTFSGGKYTFTRTTSGTLVKSYTGGGRVCRLASLYYSARQSDSLTGTGTPATSISGPTTTCGSTQYTLAHADAGDLLNGAIPVGAADLSYIDSAGNFARTGSFSDLTTVGAPLTVSGTLSLTSNVIAGGGWEWRAPIMFGLDTSGTPFMSGAMFNETMGSSKEIVFPFEKTLTGSAAQQTLSNDMTLSWNDPRDSRSNVSAWTVSTSRKVGGSYFDAQTQAGVPSSRVLNIDPQVNGYNHTFTIQADLTVPDIGHRGAKYTVTGTNFVGGLNHAPVVTVNSVLNTNANASSVVAPVTVTDADAGDVVTLSVTAQPANGSVTVNAGQFFFTPNVNFVGSDSFTVQAIDQLGAANSQVVSVSVVCPDPTVTGISIADSQMGPYRGTTASLAYSSNTCNGGLPVTFRVKDGNGNSVAGTTQGATANDGVGQIKTFTFTDVPPGTFTVEAKVYSNNKPGFSQTVVGGVNYKSEPIANANIASNKVSPTEDDLITVSVAGSPLCTFYSNVSSARLNKGCVVEWNTSSGIVSSVPNGGNELKIMALRGSNSVSAVVRAYNTDGSSFAQDPVVLNFNVAAPLNVVVDKAFSKAGQYSQLDERFDLTLSGNGVNQCQLVASDAQAQSIVDGSGKACVLEFTALPNGVKQVGTTLAVSGRLKSATGNDVSYKISRYYAPGVKALINSETVSVPTASTTYLASAVLGAKNFAGNDGYTAELNVLAGSSCTQTSSVSTAKTSWSGVGKPNCVVEWTAIPAGLGLATVNGKPGIQGVPGSQDDQVIGYKTYFVDEDGSEILIDLKAGVVVDRAPTVSVPALVTVDTDSNEAVVSGIGFSDADIGDTATLSLSSAASNGTATVLGGVVKYKPAASYVGSDSFSITAKDKFGVVKTVSVPINVECGMPVSGGVVNSAPGGFWASRPMTVTGTYAPAHTCHSGFSAKLEILSLGGAVVKTIDVPSSSSTSLVLGVKQNAPVYEDVTFDTGSYNSRLKITSNADTNKIAYISGDPFIVVPLIGPSLSMNKVAPSEDDDIRVKATDLALCPYFASIADARAAEGCYIDWTVTTGVKKVKQIDSSSVEIASTAGAETVNGTVRAYKNNGSYFELPASSLLINVTNGSPVPVDGAFSKSGAYRQYMDTMSLVVSAGSGALCTISATDAQAQASVDAGNHACVLEFTDLPTGVKQDVGVLAVRGRMTASSGNDVKYKVSRYYGSGTKKALNTGSFNAPTDPFAPTVNLTTKQETISTNSGLSVQANISSGPWNCTQTGSIGTAAGSWTLPGDATCLVEWSNLGAGIVAATVDGKPGVKGIPSVAGDIKLGYTVSIVDQTMQKFPIYSSSMETVVRAPVLTVPSSIVVDTNSGFKTISGISATDADAGDTVAISVSVDGQHGSAVSDLTGQSYKPATSYVGADTFELKATDAYGAFNKKSVLVDVDCSMPTMGEIKSPDAGGFLATKPVNFVAKFSPRHLCHAGYQMTLEIVDGQGNVVRSISSPTSIGNGTDSFGNAQGVLTYNNVSFQAGSYTTRLKLKSNAFTSKEVVLDGDNFVARSVPAPSLSANMIAPTEDDTVRVTGLSSECTTFAASPAEAVANKNCYMEWSKTGTVLSVGRLTNNEVNVRGNRGAGSIRGTLKMADEAGILQSVSYADIGISFGTGNSAPLINASFSQGNYVQIVDYVAGGLSVDSNGYACQLVKSIEDGVAITTGGGKACLISYTHVPDGMRISADGITFTGRLINSTDKKFSYTVARVYADGSVAHVPGGEFLVPVSEMALRTVIQKSKVAYAAGIQDALVSLKIDDVSVNSVSCAQTASETEARDSWNNNGTPKCLITWTSIPVGLALDGVTNLTLIGKPLSTTGNDIGYTVEFVDNFGSRFVAKSGTGSLTVRDPISPSYTLAGKNGKFVTDTGEEYWLVSDDGELGNATVTGGDFADMHVVVRDVLGVSGVTTDIANQPNGTVIPLKVSQERTNAWSSRNVSMSLSYEGLGDLLVNNENLRIMRMPPKSLIVRVNLPKTVVDTALFAVTLKIGEVDARNVQAYNRDIHGLWKAMLAEKTPTGGVTPVTQVIDISGNDGQAVFDGLKAQDLQGKNLIGVIVPNTPGGHIVGNDYMISSEPLKINFVPGGGLPATLRASRASGSIPLSVKFDVGMDFSYRDDVQSITYEYQLNDGDWIMMNGVRAFSGNYTFTEGGIYNVRAVITNKNTLAISQTSPVTIAVKQTLKMTMTNNALALPSTPVEMSVVTRKPNGDVVPFVNEWQIYRQGASMEVLANVNSYTFTSDVPQVVNVKVRARPAELPADDPESWVEVSRTVTFGIPDKPRAAINGAQTMEAGMPIDFTVTTRPSWSEQTSTTLKVGGKWILPDGTEVQGSEKLTWAPTPESVPSGGAIIKLKYAAWVVGAEAQTTVVAEKKIYVRKYEFPTFKTTVKADTTYAPAFVTMNVVPNSPADVKLMSGKKFTYTWTVPTGVVSKVSGSKLSGNIDYPGTYAFQVKAEDDRGNSQLIDSNFEIVESRPFGLTMKMALAQKFNRAPAKYSVKAEIVGGHPKDRIKKISAWIDGTMVLDSGVRNLMNLTLPDAGEHTVTVKMESVFGVNLETSQTVTIAENVPPTCTMAPTWDVKGAYVQMKSACKDVDGLLKKYEWYVDEVLQVGKVATNFTWVLPEGVSGGNIKLVTTDDSGASVTTVMDVTKP